MEPTLHTNNILITDRVSPRFHRIVRGDIIIATNPTNPTQSICKRVTGLPGDKIVIRNASAINPFSKDKPSDVTPLSVDNNVPKKGSDIEQISTAVTSPSLTPSSSPASIDDEIDQPQQSWMDMVWKNKTVVVPRGHIWVEGDNIENSSDSRYYGPIPQGLVKSRAVLRIWPLTEFRFF